jgi:hypothetical protein
MIGWRKGGDEKEGVAVLRMPDGKTEGLVPPSLHIMRSVDKVGPDPALDGLFVRGKETPTVAEVSDVWKAAGSRSKLS